MFEAVTAVENNIELELLIDSGKMLVLISFFFVELVLFSSDFHKNSKMTKQQLLAGCQETVEALDVGKAQATVEQDRQLILGMVQKREGGISKFNSLMKGLLQDR